MDDQLSLYIISDSLGETARAIANACMQQFPQHENWQFERFPYINTKELLDEVFEKAKTKNVCLMFSLVDDDLANYAQQRSEKENFVYVDLLSNVIKAMSKISGLAPLGQPGLLRKLDREYFRRVEAIEFAVKYDDGKDPRGILLADLVLLGISRTSKTPLSMFLADKHVKVVNIPLIPEVPIPKEIYEIDPKKIIGLTNSVERLSQVRKERLKSMGITSSISYANGDRIYEETRYAEKLMRQLKCPIIDVSDKAIEETATIILEILEK
ncbi:pyruvate, water dikinase regulatory protein [Streptococcus porcinus]|uniref:Putative pyruvate, phosphate dikinase regulatory protein n=1 Tax=Streptococcus porcinus TaxID=1340 RepID=A0A7V9WRQ9_STRPO|nr:pyruvate, water dikinase regulatory protein [Streptococcus porcinus]MBA2795854.1 kinase/pyrophosphorylase [Streptococcus porcinus]